jgi:hypothetical protein
MRPAAPHHRHRKSSIRVCLQVLGEYLGVDVEVAPAKLGREGLAFVQGPGLAAAAVAVSNAQKVAEAVQWEDW